MKNSERYFQSSIGRKQTVAVTGLLLVFYVILHLAGNLLIYLGPKVFNAYAEFLAGLRPGLYVIEFLLAAVFAVHIYFTYMLVLENIQARGGRYAVEKPKGARSLATRLSTYTGTILFIFVVMHVRDFTLTDHHGVHSILADGRSYGLYGVVYNAFSNPLHSEFYIIAMAALGFHLTHGIQSFAQTFGCNHPRYTPMLHAVSNGLGVLIAVGFSTIPVYVLILNFLK